MFDAPLHWRQVNSSGTLFHTESAVIKVRPVGNSYNAVRCFAQQGARMECDIATGCHAWQTRRVAADSDFTIHLIQAGRDTVIELQYPASSRNADAALSEAIEFSSDIRWRSDC